MLSCFLSVNEDYVKDMLIFWGKTGKENDRLGEERQGYSDREDEERLKGQ